MQVGQRTNLLAFSAPLVTGYTPFKETTVMDFSRRATTRVSNDGTLAVLATSNIATRDGMPFDGPAARGRDGSSGSRGISPGSSGSSGGLGGPGADGLDGRTGEPAGNVLVSVASAANTNEITVWRSDTRSSSVFDLSQPGFVLVDARGGDGSPGQHAGAGGAGGHGGAGCRGRKGTHGGQNGRGGSGGRGGNGGNGGSGGRGGNGGRGGDGGDAGHVVISVPEGAVELAWVFEADARLGFAAPGGAAGAGGPGGRGGSGGSGGSGGGGKYSGFSGSSGSRGRDGSRGSAGNPGQMGRNGRMGSVKYQVTRNGTVIASGNDRFNAAVESFTVFDDNGDGVFEPGSELLIRDAVWRNTGDLHFPAGAVVTFHPDDSSISDRSSHVCPGLAIGAPYAVPHQFRMRLEDAGEPQHNKPYRREMHVLSRVSLLNRPFPQATVQSAPVVVEWPVRVEEIIGVDWLGAGEIARMVVRIRNVASRPYGGDAGDDGDASAGKVELRLAVDPLLYILPTDPSTLAYGQLSSYTVLDDGHAASIVLPQIPAASTVDVVLTVQMAAEAGSKLFCRLPMRYDLLLRDRCIEYYSRTLRVTPIYVANTASDALLVTCDKLARGTFLAWSYLFQMLGLSVQFWDIQRYNGFIAGDVTWVGSVRLFVVPSYRLGDENRADAKEVLDFLRLAEVTQHMKGFVDTAGAKAIPAAYPLRGTASSDQAMVLLGFGPDRAATRLLYDLCQPLKGILGFGLNTVGDGHIVTLGSGHNAAGSGFGTIGSGVGVGSSFAGSSSGVGSNYGASPSNGTAGGDSNAGYTSSSSAFFNAANNTSSPVAAPMAPVFSFSGSQLPNSSSARVHPLHFSGAPKEVPLPAPASTLGGDTLTADDGHKAIYRLSGGGSCCCICACCCDSCSDDPAVLFKALQRDLADKDPSRMYLIAHQESLTDSILEVGCCTSESCQVSIYPCLYKRSAPVAATPDAKIDDGWVPYTFDNATFSARQEPWQPGPFMDAFIAIFHTLPIEHRIMTLANNYLARLQFNLPLCGVVGMNAVVLASLMRTIQAEYDAGDAALPLANRLSAACMEHPEWVKGDSVYLVISALRGPGIDSGSDLGERLSELAETLAGFFADKVGSTRAAVLQQSRSIRPPPMRCADDDVYNKVVALAPSFGLLWLPCAETDMHERFSWGTSRETPLGLGPLVRTFDAAAAEEQATSWYYSDTYAVQRLQQRETAAAAAAAQAAMRAAAAAAAAHHQQQQQQEQQWQNYALPSPQWAAQLPPDYTRMEAPAPPPDTMQFAVVEFNAPPVYEDAAAAGVYKAGPPAYEPPSESSGSSEKSGPPPLFRDATVQPVESTLEALSRQALADAEAAGAQQPVDQAAIEAAQQERYRAHMASQPVEEPDPVGDGGEAQEEVSADE